MTTHPRYRVPQTGSGAGIRGGDDAGRKKVPGRGAELDLFFLDETGFSPSLSLDFAGRATDHPLREPAEAARERPGRPRGPGPHAHASLTWRTAARPWKGEQILDFLRRALPGRAARPRIVVLDNAGIHHARTVRQARRELAERGLWLWYLPAPAPN